MVHQGFVKVAAATPMITVGDIKGNTQAIKDVLEETHAGIIVFPELSLTGYTAGDMFYQDDFIRGAQDALIELIGSVSFDGVFIVGLPLDVDGILLNVAAVCHKGAILGFVPKRYLPNNHEFYEMRWFTSADHHRNSVVNIAGNDIQLGNLIFEDAQHDIRFGVEVCQDLWMAYTPADDMALAGVNMVFNLSASTEHVTKPNLRRNVVTDHSRKQMTAYVYTTSGQFESTSEIVFSPHRIIAFQGTLLSESMTFSQRSEILEEDIDIRMLNHQKRQDTTYRSMQGMQRETYRKVQFALEDTPDYTFCRPIDTHPFVFKDPSDLGHAATLQAHALARRIQTMPGHSRRPVIGISGGLDSTLALLVACQAADLMGMPRNEIIGVTMPSTPTPSTSLERAQALMDSLGITAMTVPIEASLARHLDDIAHDQKDVTYENAQARIRTLILMDLSNKHGGFVLGTGDMSEIALGWMTYNGDHMSMYAINSGVPKTLVRALVAHHASHGFEAISPILFDVIGAPVSPELREGQKTEETIGPYDQNDFIMYHHLHGGKAEPACTYLLSRAFILSEDTAHHRVAMFFKRFYGQQFKRQTLPEGPKIVSVGLSPRSDFRMPSDVRRT